MAKALVVLAEGVEEMEAVIVIDILRRAGVEVLTAATHDNREVVASRGVRLVADTLLTEVRGSPGEALVIPGGAVGSRRLAADPRVLELVRTYVRNQKLVAAICAGPLVLQAAGVLEGVRFTCHPGARDLFPGRNIAAERVVTDGAILTSQGPGTSMEFALAIARHLVSPATVEEVAAGLILPG
jgi:4-methyl-5(b-hydroxyethyl)-thiazole monophosphate biosynthesis